MNLSFLSPLYSRHGPYACVYLDTSRDVEDPERAIGLRWRHLKQELDGQGVDTATAGALAHAVGADRELPGTHGQAVFAAHGRLALVEELPEPPVRDRARFTMVPDAMPLAVQHAPAIPYAAAAVRRVPLNGGGLSGQELDAEMQSGSWPSTTVAGAEPETRRVPAGAWRQGVVSVARELAELADRVAAEVVVVSGDPWACGVLVHALPGRLRDRVIGVQSADRPAEPGRALLEDELTYLFRGRMTIQDRARVDQFQARRARGRGAAEGLPGVVEALRRGQVEALLVNDPTALEGRLWVGMAPRQIGLSEEELRAYGVRSSWPEPADAALLRAVVGTGAELVVVPRHELPLTGGLGALLRYPDQAG